MPILAGDLEDRYDLNNLVTKNYGVAGERSDQILKRVKNDEDLRQDLSQADLITLTVGGNDVLKVIQSNFFGLSIETFTEPMEDYKERLKDLFAQIRDLNSDAPIYVLGIYNPFYLNFPEITDMQTIIDNWNKQTETFVNQQEKAFFIPINDLLYKGLSDEVGIADTEEGNQRELPNHRIQKVYLIHQRQLRMKRKVVLQRPLIHRKPLEITLQTMFCMKAIASIPIILGIN